MPFVAAFSKMKVSSCWVQQTDVTTWTGETHRCNLYLNSFKELCDMILIICKKYAD